MVFWLFFHKQPEKKIQMLHRKAVLIVNQSWGRVGNIKRRSFEYQIRFLIDRMPTNKRHSLESNNYCTRASQPDFKDPLALGWLQLTHIQSPVEHKIC